MSDTLAVNYYWMFLLGFDSFIITDELECAIARCCIGFEFGEVHVQMCVVICVVTALTRKLH